ncbi:signal peptidase I [Luteibacter sp. 22Crub2.1]|uniref:signal peptidase I n=1 Tax=Luteibacter sp. 22Crub2.1 TaxID=1283288 RepID=UPI0009A8FB75|nr:signal peptidase I [Luteibacter sp. 22Crub2.1]SKB61145.1 signal peptidase I . Serine peptidase. MEROPS family S26A [Luteibacter sp. 22Crub2.1]
MASFDFSAILLGLTVLFGVIWLIDWLFLAKSRRARSEASGTEQPEPWPVDWARSLFPVILVVLLLRSFVAEPFRIPSGSMMPTLDVGDFILVNKFAYGLRMPAFNNKLLENGEPRRGDVVVFRFPGYVCTDESGHTIRSGDVTCANPHEPVPGENWIKRVIGLPGDRIETRGSELYINGERIGADEIGPFKGSMTRREDRLLMTFGSKLYTEHLGSINHTIALTPAYNMPMDIPNDKVPSEVPKGCYIVMGDNRMNSTDSRWWGCMPEQNLVGKAFFVWLAWRGLDNGILDFSKMGKVIH